MISSFFFKLNHLSRAHSVPITPEIRPHTARRLSLSEPDRDESSVARTCYHLEELLPINQPLTVGQQQGVQTGAQFKEITGPSIFGQSLLCKGAELLVFKQIFLHAMYMHVVNKYN